MLNFAIIGLGGLGKVHFKNYFEIKEKFNADINLVALCDVDETQFTKEIKTNLGGDSTPIDVSAFHLYTDADEMFEKEKLDFVVTALPTYIHETIAVKAMDRGIHVFSEKPMAITVETCQNMIDAAKRNGVKLQIGQCCRFESPRVNIKKILDEGKFGKVIRAEFSRFSPKPLWSWQNWILDYDKSGGAVLDLHVHDVDTMQWLFGKPKSVISAASHVKDKFESICSNFIYDGFYVTTMTDWSMAKTTPFVVRGIVNLEKATLEMKDDGSVCVYPEDGETYSIPCAEYNNMYVSEILEFVDCIEKDRSSDIINPESTKLTVELSYAEKASAERGEMIYV